LIYTTSGAGSAAGKQTYSALLSASAMEKTISLRGSTNKCNNIWGDTILEIYRLDF
jgi:hypothetical protein